MWLAISIIAIIMLMHFNFKHFFYNFHKNVPRASDIEEGDIIAFACDHSWNHLNILLYFMMNLCQNLMYPDMIFTHFGIVARKRDKLCLCHTTSEITYDYKDAPAFRKPVIEELDPIIKCYPGYVFVLKNPFKDPSYRLGPNISNGINEIISNRYNICRDVELSTSPLRWLDIGIKTKYFTGNDITCYEFIYDILCDFDRRKNSNIHYEGPISNKDIINLCKSMGYRERHLYPNYFLSTLKK